MTNPKKLLPALSIVAAGVLLLHASGPMGVYARIDKVVLEPGSGSPDRIQIWGVFSIATPNGANDAYQAPVRGYLYFSLPSDQPIGRKEWADLKALAGTGEIAAFGSRWATAPRLHKKDEAPQDPDQYVLNTGVNRMRSRTDYPPVRALLDFKD